MSQCCDNLLQTRSKGMVTKRESHQFCCTGAWSNLSQSIFRSQTTFEPDRVRQDADGLSAAAGCTVQQDISIHLKAALHKERFKHSKYVSLGWADNVPQFSS